MSAELQKVRRAARKAALARDELHARIDDAAGAASLRQIADAAGMSHEQVRRILGDHARRALSLSPTPRR